MSDEGTVTVPLKTDPTTPAPAKRKPLGENHIGSGTPAPVAPDTTGEATETADARDNHHRRGPLTNHIGSGTPAGGDVEDGDTPPPNEP